MPPEPLGNQITLSAGMLSDPGAHALVDEQSAGAQPMFSASQSAWDPPANASYPVEVILDLGEERHLSHIALWDGPGEARTTFYSGSSGAWKEIAADDGAHAKQWNYHSNLDARTRYLRMVKHSPGPVGEILLYEYTPEQARARAEESRKAAAEAEAEKARLAALLEQAKKGTSRPLTDTGTLFGKLPLVDEIDPAAPQNGRAFFEQPKGSSRIETILGKPARVLPNTLEEPAYFAYALGEGKMLHPGKAYLLTVEIPEDAPRTFVVANRGADLVRGIQTGQSLGDTIFGHTATNLESLQIPLSGKYELFQQIFWLNENLAGFTMPRGENPPRTPYAPGAGFLVIVAQWESRQTPVSQGAAVGKIRLFEVPDPEQFNAQLRFPPDGLPRRHIFKREEMADSVITQPDPTRRAFTARTDWYDIQFRTMNFLGMNTYSKDLLEFGAVQGWDVLNAGWYVESKFPELWESILPRAAKHNLNILPYYEYAGSTGPGGFMKKTRERVQPLVSKNDYTHITWAESKKVDLTDPLVLQEFLRVLDLTIIRFKDQAHFVGAWIRPRVSQMPISFADPTLARFAKEANNDTAVTREELKEDKALLERYYTWWDGKRKEFLVGVRDHLSRNGIADPLVFFMAVSAEPAPPIKTPKNNQMPLVTDDPEMWTAALAGKPDYAKIAVMPLSEVLDQQLYRTAVKQWVKTFGNWEWHHASPRPDPQNYKDVEGVLMTYPFNRRYTVADPDALEDFRSKSGLALIRHYPLNENTMGNLLGYFVTDVDRTGPYGVLAEALAVANGDPWYIGYTSSHIYNRPFPDAVRKFNANFLSLPALPSTRIENACADPEVVVREIRTPKSGTYYAVVNTGMGPKTNVTVSLPAPGAVVEAATGSAVQRNGRNVSLALAPFELRALLAK
jgi:hypothetical protein